MITNSELTQINSYIRKNYNLGGYQKLISFLEIETNFIGLQELPINIENIRYFVGGGSNYIFKNNVLYICTELINY